jgi:23S rRNA (adenine2503-C2)-methyltransferase
MPADLLGLPFPALADHLDAIGVGRVHAARVFGGLHRRDLPLAGIPDLGRHAARIDAASTVATAHVTETVRSEDGTERLVLTLHDGARIESVLVPMGRGRTTLCVSTQVGCAMACAFCATGTLGLTRHLAAGEIVAQIHAARRHGRSDGRRVERLVFMGMGEPLHNDLAVHDAVRVLTDPHGPGLGAASIVVSTVGLVGKLRAFSQAFGGRVGLALSLHAGTDATRRALLPVARSTSLAELKQALRDHPLPGGRWMMLEVVVLPGVNDGEADLDGLAAFADGLRAVVNLIPFNPFPGAPFRSPTTEEVRAMEAALKARGVLTTVRWPRGRAADGACGQLALRGAA